jgi:hypothetical protein
MPIARHHNPQSLGALAGQVRPRPLRTVLRFMEVFTRHQLSRAACSSFSPCPTRWDLIPDFLFPVATFLGGMRLGNRDVSRFHYAAVRFSSNSSV